MNEWSGLHRTIHVVGAARGSLAKSIFVGFNALSKARSVEDAGLGLLI